MKTDIVELLNVLFKNIVHLHKSKEKMLLYCTKPIVRESRITFPIAVKQKFVGLFGN